MNLKSVLLAFIALISGFSCRAEIFAHSYTDMTGATVGNSLTSAIINNGSHGGLFGAWSSASANDPTGILVVGPHLTDPKVPISVTNTLFYGTNSHSIQINHSLDFCTLQTQLAQSYDKITWFGYIYFGVTNYPANYSHYMYDYVIFYDANGHYTCLQLRNDGDFGYSVNVETDYNGSTTHTSNLDITPQTTYWVNLQFNTSGTCQFAFFKTNDLSYFGGFTGNQVAGGKATYLRIGNNEIGQEAGVYSQIDQWGVNTNGDFPIGPLGTPLIIPDHMTTWQGNVGVYGGIPSVTTIYTNFTSANTAAEINAGIQNCPSNQVVKLAAGTYNLSSFLDLKTGVVLRGAGMTNTTINFTGSGNQALRIEGQGQSIPPAYQSFWTAGYGAGTNSITLSNALSLVAGTVLFLTQNPDPNIVSIAGNNGINAQSSGFLGNSNLVYQQQVYVTNVTGNVVKFVPPIMGTNWQTALTPQAFWLGNGTSIKKSGIEDLTITAANGTPTCNILIQDAANCWVKDVESVGGGTYNIWSIHSTLCEIRDSYLHDCRDYSGTAYGLYTEACTGFLEENNIIWNVTGPIRLAATSGSVIGYNFILWPHYTASATWLNEGIKTHGGHCFLNLFEGNITPSIRHDFVWGSSSHNLTYRNRSYGQETNLTDNTFSYNADCSNRWENVAGNVLGTSGYNTNYDLPPSAADNKYVYAYGFYDNTYAAANRDTVVSNTLLRTLNWTSAFSTNSGVVYDPSIPNRWLPSSYYLTSKPSWWDSSAWPGIGPDLSGTNFNPNPPMTRFYSRLGGTTSCSSTSLGTGTITLGNGKLIFGQ